MKTLTKQKLLKYFDVTGKALDLATNSSNKTNIDRSDFLKIADSTPLSNKVHTKKWENFYDSLLAPVERYWEIIFREVDDEESIDSEEERNDHLLYFHYNGLYFQFRLLEDIEQSSKENEENSTNVSCLYPDCSLTFTSELYVREHLLSNHLWDLTQIGEVHCRSSKCLKVFKTNEGMLNTLSTCFLCKLFLPSMT